MNGLHTLLIRISQSEDAGGGWSVTLLPRVQTFDMSWAGSHLMEPWKNQSNKYSNTNWLIRHENSNFTNIKTLCGWNNSYFVKDSIKMSKESYLIETVNVCPIIHPLLGTVYLLLPQILHMYGLKL